MGDEDYDEVEGDFEEVDEDAAESSNSEDEVVASDDEFEIDETPIKIDPLPKLANTSITLYIVPDNERMTSDRLCASEIAAVVGMRAQQTAEDGKAFIDTAGFNNPISIAFSELRQRKNPFIIERCVGTKNGMKMVERWKINEMTLNPVDLSC
jgi:hypothetical protein